MTHPYTRLFTLPAPPDADNDVTEGYELGDVVHVTGGGVYDCRDATEGAAVWEERTGGGASDWGDIGGTLADQADLQAALDAKLDDSQLEDAVVNGVTTKAPTQNAVFDALATVLSITQPLDSDLSAIAGLSPSNDDIIQRKSGAWANRTLAQFVSDITELVQDIVGAMITGGSNSGVSPAYDDAGNVIDFEIVDSYITDIIVDRERDSTGWIEAVAQPTYTSADAPIFVMGLADSIATQVGVGNKIKLIQSASTKYFIVQAKGTPSGGSTPITIYGGTDFTLANSAITGFCYSHMKSPVGFPMDPAKWTVTTTNTSNANQTPPVNNTWYNLGSIQISIPIGLWRMSYFVMMEEVTNLAAVNNRNIRATLSTANNTESNAEYTSNMIQTLPVSATATIRTPFQKNNILISMAAKTTHYLNGIFNNATAPASIAFRGDGATTKIILECAYL